MKRLASVLALFLVAGSVEAVEPRYRAIPALSWSLDRVVDVTSMGNVTGTTVATTGTICTGTDKLTTDSGGNFICAPDTGGSGSGDVTDVNEGFSIDVTGSTGPTPSVAFDNTEFTGSRTWGDASTDTIVWTWDRATGTDPTLTFGSGTVTGQTVAMTSLICTGTQKLSADSGGNFYCLADDTAPTGNAGGDLTGTYPNPTVAANAVALGTDTTNAYVTDLTAGTAIDVSGGGGETATVTVDFDSTEVEATTWGAGGNASNVWTYNLSATDPTLTISTTGFTADATVTGTKVAMTQTVCSGTDKLTTDAGGNVICASDQTGGGSSHNMLSATHSDSTAASATRGDLIVANSSASWARFAVGGSNTVLTANGTDPSWSASPTMTNLTATNTVTGVTVEATSVLQTPLGANPTVLQTGSLATDTTSGQLVFFDGTNTLALAKEQTKCATIENVTDLDVDVPLYIFEDSATVLRTACYTTGMTVEPTYALEDTKGNRIGNVATCGNTPFDWTTPTSNQSFDRAEELHFDITNTPAPTFPTFTTFCFVYRLERQ